jgi:hypothetical protein
MNTRACIAAMLCTVLASCGNGVQGGCGCPPPPLPVFLAVAQRGANEVDIYPLTSDLADPPQAVISSRPAFTIAAPGAESLWGPGLYVGEFPNTIATFTGTHNGTGISLTAAGSITSGVNDPAGFAVWPFNGTESLFVANRGGNDIAIYKGFDNVPTGFNSTPEMTISGLSAPNGLAFDHQGHLWISQASDVVEIAPPFAANSVPATTITSGVQSPSGVAFDSTGTMYVTDKGKNAIVVYPAGSTTQSLTFTNGISGPSSPVVNGSYLYVANAAGNDVSEYRLPLSSSSQPIARNAVNMNQPAAIALIQ